jgi:hypothetical protein
MPFPSLQQRCPPRAHDIVHPVAFPSPWHRWPMLSLGPQRHCPPRAHDAIKPMPSLSMQHRRPPQARNGTILYILLCHFWPTNPDFDMLHCFCSAALFWCATLPHCFGMLHCLQNIALLYYDTLPHYFDMLHCFWYAALLWYATLPHCFHMLQCFCSATLFWYATLPHYFHMLHCFCSATLLWYATLPHYFDILHITILLLFCYILVYMNAYYIAQWWKWTKWDECGNIDQHYCTINILALNNMKQIGHSIKLKSESIYMKFSSSSLPSFCMRGLFWWQKQQHNTLFIHGLCFRPNLGQQIKASWRRCLVRRSNKASSELTQTRAHSNVYMLHAFRGWNLCSVILLDTCHHLRQGH